MDVMSFRVVEKAIRSLRAIGKAMTGSWLDQDEKSETLTVAVQAQNVDYLHSLRKRVFVGVVDGRRFYGRGSVRRLRR